MSFRIKLFLIFTLTTAAAVSVFAWGMSLSTRQELGPLAGQRSDILVTQFQRELQLRGDEVVHDVEGIAEAEGTVRMALELSQPRADAALYMNDAKGLASDHHLDYLELVNDDGTLISSVQWPARAGYKNDWVKLETNWNQQSAFLRRVDMQDAVQLGLLAVRAVHVGDRNLYVIGGRRVDRNFLSAMVSPAGARALLYLNLEAAFVPTALTDAEGPVSGAERFAPVIQSLQSSGVAAEYTLAASGEPSRHGFAEFAKEMFPGLASSANAETFVTSPLTGRNGELLGAVLVGSSQREMTALLGDTRSLALLVAAVAILLGIILTWWVSMSAMRPLRQVAEGARAVAGGNWNARVEAPAPAHRNKNDEFGELARSFNDMTRHLADERERLLQAERVAAWREVARRLGNEVKDPLFPLQIAVEDLAQVRGKLPRAFDQVFFESVETLQSELENLRTVVARFGDFAKMPPPHLQPVNVNDLLRTAVKGLEPRFSAIGRPPISPELHFNERAGVIKGDPEWLHRAFDILLALSVDAMAAGGVLTIRVAQKNNDVLRVSIANTGAEVNRENIERMFVPYDASKQRRNGAGLGLATVQAIVSDHGGRMFVDSAPGAGTTYHLEFPATAAERARSAAKGLVATAAPVATPVALTAAMPVSPLSLPAIPETAFLEATAPESAVPKTAALEPSIPDPVPPVAAVVDVAAVADGARVVDVAPVIDVAPADDADPAGETDEVLVATLPLDIKPAQWQPRREIPETPRRPSTLPRLFDL